MYPKCNEIISLTIARITLPPAGPALNVEQLAEQLAEAKQ